VISKQVIPRQRVEALYKESVQKHGETMVIINGLLNAYAILRELPDAKIVFQKLLTEEKQITTEVFTSMMKCYYRGLEVSTAFDMYSQRYLYIQQEDDLLIGTMINMCWVYKEAEKAMSYWNKLHNKGFRINANHYTGLLHTLSTRKDYSEEALDIYTKMIQSNIQPTPHSLLYALKCASNIGKVTMAYDILGQIKQLSYPIESGHISAIIVTYSNAVEAPMMPKNISELYLEDSWNIINQLISEGKSELITPQVLNSLIRLNCAMFKTKEAEELVLPLFDSLNLSYDCFTYEVII
jgi:pentatricopeptide repeat protein